MESLPQPKILTEEQIDTALTRCLATHPIVDQVLPPESNALVELIAMMFYTGSRVVDVATLNSETITAIAPWLNADMPIEEDCPQPKPPC